MYIIYIHGLQNLKELIHVINERPFLTSRSGLEEKKTDVSPRQRNNNL